MPGTTSATTRPARAPIAGEKTASAGFCDDKQLLCFSLALWNGKDPILKERLFGLTNSEGNHGEDVKEYYFYLDSTPTHSYMKYLYKYPQAAYPYDEPGQTRTSSAAAPIWSTNCSTLASSTRIATGMCLSSTPRRRAEDVLIQITACNRGPRSGDAARAADAVVSQYLDLGPMRAEAAMRQVAAKKGSALCSASHDDCRRALLVLRGRRSAAVHRERNEQRARSSASLIPVRT